MPTYQSWQPNNFLRIMKGTLNRNTLDAPLLLLVCFPEADHYI